MSNMIAGLLRNVLTTRSRLMSKLFELDPRRNIDSECGHPEEVPMGYYKNAFYRGDLARRVVTVYPEECWASRPVVYETENPEKTPFETAWEGLQRKWDLFTSFKKLDIISGIGRFGVLLIGFDDGLELDQPVAEGARKLIYLRTFDETVVSINKLEIDVKNPRYGLPVEYQIQFIDPGIGLNTFAANIATKRVHWSRIIHVADNTVDSQIVGRPRMEVVVNRLLDLKKNLGGSAEALWKGGFPGYSLEAVPDAEGATVEIDEASTKEQMEAYMNSLQRYIAVSGITVKSLSPQVADPRPHIEIQVRMIAMALGVPWRILMGVEVGQLASEQDIRVWNRRLLARNNEHITPFILKPFIDRMIQFEILPKPGEGEDPEYFIKWPDLNNPSDVEKADIAGKKSTALMQYVTSGADAVIPVRFFLTLVMGFSEEEADAVMLEAGDSLEHLDAMRTIEQKTAEAGMKQQQKMAAAPLPKSTAPAKK